mmetsp:Transcript_43471/g.114659  ORF Transcript_43471/g.114659 Transcript_43471/m.114659 type:complete len:300 (-) Transcript_43471:77-976(-)
MASTFFAGFRLGHASTRRGTIRFRIGGAGPPVLLLHGNPQTHACWHAVAPLLVNRFTVICPDLPGYGESFKPVPAVDHLPHSKRAIANDIVDFMDGLGFQEFRVVGHDRGGRVGHRLALDHPSRVRALATLDIVPTLHHFEKADADFAMGYYHWFWLAQPRPFPESVINAAPDAWFQAHCSREPKDLNKFFHPSALEDYLSAVRQPPTIEGICEEYRAAASIDLVHDRESRASGNTLTHPLFVMWGSKGKIGKWYDPLNVWRSFSSQDVNGCDVPCGHYIPEEAPEEVSDHLIKFFGTP